MEFKSEGMNRIFSKIDRYMLELEEDIEFLSNKVNELEKEKGKLIDESFNRSQFMMANTFNAILDKPKLDSVSAVVLLKIKDMQDIKEVHKYIDEIIEENRKNGVITK